MAAMRATAANNYPKFSLSLFLVWLCKYFLTKKKLISKESEPKQVGANFFGQFPINVKPEQILRRKKQLVNLSYDEIRYVDSWVEVNSIGAKRPQKQVNYLELSDALGIN